MENQNKNDVRIGIILGYFEVESTPEEIIYKWKPNCRLGMSAESQLEHNQRVDPNFKMVRIEPNCLELGEAV